MAPSSPPERVPAAADLDPAPRRLARALRSAAHGGVRCARAVAFWVGVALPFVYLPLLVGGLGQFELATFVGAIAANYLALLLGSGYRRPRRAAG